jgi:hypothetical protein
LPVDLELRDVDNHGSEAAHLGGPDPKTLPRFFAERRAALNDHVGSETINEGVQVCRRI